MNLSRLILLFLFIIIVNCEFIDYGIEEIASLILSAGNSDGTIAKELDPDSTGDETRPIEIDVSKANNEGQLMNIKQIVPSLNNLEGKELDDKFKKLYDLSKRVFNTFMDGEEERGDEIDYVGNVNSYDFLRQLILTKDENESIGICNNNLKTRIVFLRNDDYNTMMKKFIYESYTKKKGKFTNIDINNFDKLDQTIQSSWQSRNTDGIPSDNLSKAIAIKCIKTRACNVNFEKIKDNEVNNYLDQISFNIVETTDLENNLYYSLIINNDNTLKIYHAFTLKYDGKLYSSYEKFPSRVNDYDDISYLVEGYHYSVNEETNEIEREGISLVAESGINLIVRPTDNKGEPILLTPSDYIVKDKNGNIKRDSISNIALNSEIATDDDIKNLLHIKRKTYYNIISNKYSSKFASINELSKRFLNERLENLYTDPLTEYELLNLNALHQIMGIKYTFKDPLQEYQDGMLHHNKNQEIEFINRVSYLEESRYLSSFTQTEINFNFRDCESNDCFKNFAYPITYYDLEETLSKFDDYISQNFENILKKRAEEESSGIDKWFTTYLTHRELINRNVNEDMMEDLEMVSQTLIDVMQEEFRAYKSRYELHQQDESFPLTEDDVHNARTLDEMLNCLGESFNAHAHRFGPLRNGYQTTNDPDPGNQSIDDSGVEETYLDLYMDSYGSTSSEENDENNPSQDNQNNERSRPVLSERLHSLVMDEDIPDSRLEEEKKRLKKKGMKVKRILEKLKIKNNDENEPANGSEATFKLDNAIKNKLKTIAPNDKKIQGARTTPESKIPKSTNVFSLKNTLGNLSSLKDFIVNKVFSKDMMSLIGTYIKYELYSLAESQQTATDEMMEDLVDLRTQLKEKINRFLDNEDLTSNRLNEAEHLVDAVTTYNGIISFTIRLEPESNGGLNDQLEKIDPEEDEFMEKVEFLRNENLLDGLNKLIRNNHEKLGIIIEGDINDFDIRERLNSGVGSKTYKFNEYSESVEPSSEDLSKLLNIDLDSKGEGIAYIANSGKPEECADIKRSISIKNKIHKLQSPVSRDQDEIDENEVLSNTISRTAGDISGMDGRRVESYERSTFRTFSEYLESLSYTGAINLDSASNGDDDSFQYSSVCSFEIEDSPRGLFDAISDGTTNAINEVKSDPVRTEELKNNIIKSDKRANAHLENLISNTSDCVDIENGDTIDEQLSTLNQFSRGMDSVSSANANVGSDFESTINSDSVSRSSTHLGARNELSKEKTKKKPKKNGKLRKLLKKITQKLH
ncbi:hypothetical protein H8356DRAFT_1036224 [Neocallimastix lanati (nom. inval.)]|nr:hypothetical protein H8356DRAFT_1046454 [Neocallimastix sp. JGI-2020a]KAG4100493.1 hypothetical protein H8356DRAFT_1036224 [Neocallimastix sp. JGI-2020a]